MSTNIKRFGAEVLKTTKNESFEAWHWLPESKTLRHRKTKTEVEVGKTIKLDRPNKLVMCRHGLHASIKFEDAMAYGQSFGRYLCRVKVSGTVLHSTDKIAGSRRTVIEMIDMLPTYNYLIGKLEGRFRYTLDKRLQPIKAPVAVSRVIRGIVTKQAAAYKDRTAKRDDSGRVVYNYDVNYRTSMYRNRLWRRLIKWMMANFKLKAGIAEPVSALSQDIF